MADANDPAFPDPAPRENGKPGLTIRQLFALVMMHANRQATPGGQSPQVAKNAMDDADALLAWLNVPRG